MPGSPSTLAIYLNQWVKVASGDRVKLHSGTSVSLGGGQNSWYVFRCVCGDNWHVGAENFIGTDAVGNTSDVIPSVLSDWVKKHRHVCAKFIGDVPVGQPDRCYQCKWPYGAHEESWMGPVKTVNQETLVTPNTPNTPSTHMTFVQSKGRKFRDEDEGDDANN
jgi:hypothetical protein